MAASRAHFGRFLHRPEGERNRGTSGTIHRFTVTNSSSHNCTKQVDAERH